MKVDEVLFCCVKGISDLIAVPGLMNWDLEEMESVMRNGGSAWLGIGNASGENSVVEAARNAIDSPLAGASIKEAKHILLNVTGGALDSVSMDDLNVASAVIQKVVNSEACISYCSSTDEALEESIRVTVIATGFENHKAKM